MPRKLTLILIFLDLIFLSVSIPGLGAETLTHFWRVLPMYRSLFEFTVNEIFFEPLNSKVDIINCLVFGFTGD